jgi:hypothetical protein
MRAPSRERGLSAYRPFPSALLLLAGILGTAAGCRTAPESTPRASAPTASTLSLLEPREGRCQWLRVDPLSQKRVTVASFEGDCKGARIAWSSDLRQALIWFDPHWLQSAGYFSRDASPAGYPDEKPTPNSRPRLYEVTLDSGKTRELPLPSLEGELRTFGYKGTELLALSIQEIPQEQQGQRSITVDGQVLTFDEGLEGIRALASAWRIGEAGPPQRVEVKTTTVGADLSLGISALDAARNLGPRSTELLEAHLRNQGPAPTEAQLAALLPLVPAPMAKKVQTKEGAGEVSWAHGVTPAGSFYVWEIIAEFAYTTGHVVFETGGRLHLAPDLGFTDGDLVSVSSQGTFVLVSASNVGTHPRLYDLRSGQQVFRSDTARAVTFWPSH